MAFRKVMITVALLSITGPALGCGGDTTVTPQAPQNEAPLLAPTNVRATRTAGGDVVLTWDANTQPTLAGFNVYRHDPTLSQIGLLNPAPITGTRYVDATAQAARTYEYRVVAVSVKGQESAYTSVVITTEAINSGKDRKMTRP